MPFYFLNTSFTVVDISPLNLYSCVKSIFKFSSDDTDTVPWSLPYLHFNFPKSQYQNGLECDWRWREGLKAAPRFLYFQTEHNVLKCKYLLFVWRGGDYISSPQRDVSVKTRWEVGHCTFNTGGRLKTGLKYQLLMTFSLCDLRY